MDQFFHGLYLSELDSQCRYVWRATAGLNRHLARGCTDIEGVFFCIQSILVHVASISRLLWPPKNAGDRAIKRGKELRALLEVPDEHVLRSRDVRNHIEHYDERLDAWIQESQHHNIAVDIIGPAGVFGGPNMSQRDVFRQFDPASLTVYFGESSCNVNEIAAGVEDLQKRIRTWQEETGA